MPREIMFLRAWCVCMTFFFLCTLFLLGTQSQEIGNKIATCEKNLPRTETCVIIAVRKE